MQGHERDLESGAGGLSTAITARKSGLDVIIIEKEGRVPDQRASRSGHSERRVSS